MNANPRFVSLGMLLFLFSSAFLVALEHRQKAPATTGAGDARAVFEEALTALGNKKTVTLSSGSAEAKAAFADAVHALELTHFHRAFELAQEAIDRDPAFAFAYWLESEATQETDKRAAAMSKALDPSSNASPGERAVIAASDLARERRLEEAISCFERLAAKLTDERLVYMKLGELYMWNDQNEAAAETLDRAKALDDTTPRVHRLWNQARGNHHILAGNYPAAREAYEKAIGYLDRDESEYGLFFPLAWTHLYEGDLDPALEVIDEFLRRYNRNGAAQGFPPVWIWTHTARINMEFGRIDTAMQQYETACKSVGPSQLDSTQKALWEGRCLYGKARGLAKLGRHEEAWQIVRRIKKRIDDAGDRGRRYLTSHHYMAGYLENESGDYKKAIEHLELADKSNPFHALLLARAYEGSGDIARARKEYERITKMNSNSVERALAYPEAVKKLESLPSTN